MSIKTRLKKILDKEIKFKSFIKSIVAVIAVVSLIYLLGTEYILTGLRDKAAVLICLFILILFRRKWLLERFRSLESINIFGVGFSFREERGNGRADSEEASVEESVNNDGYSFVEETEEDFEESDEDFFKRVEDEDVSSLGEDEAQRYYHLVKPDKNFSSFKYKSFIYQPSALVPISTSARAFLADGDFLELSLGKKTVSARCVFVAWQKVEFIVSQLNRKKGGNELAPSSGGPDPAPRGVISFEDKLQYLVQNDCISSSLVGKISVANETQHAIAQYQDDEIETHRAREFVDLVINIINQFQNENGIL